MKTSFEYGYGRVCELSVGETDRKSKQGPALLLHDEPLHTTPRFWTSLQVRFGFSANIFTYFRHEEVFRRISTVAASDHIRWCIERDARGHGKLLAITNPKKAYLPHGQLTGLLRRYGAENVTYSNGVVTSMHRPRSGGAGFTIAGDSFENRFLMQVPIDGYGRPSIFLSLLREICSNGAVARAPAFRSELALGRGEADADYALVRAMEGFNNEEGFCALRQRFDSATHSWASVNEANRLYKILARLRQERALSRARGGDGASEGTLGAFHRMTGDTSQIYGMANLDALSVKRQRTLPVACKVYDLLNFASELSTHHAEPAGQRALQAFIGTLIATEYDLEGTVDHFSDWKDFFITNEATTETLAAMQRR